MVAARWEPANGEDPTTVDRTCLELAAQAVVQAFGLDTNASTGTVGVFAF